jgi:hypothetical protein
MFSDLSRKHKQSHKTSMVSEKKTEYSSISNLMIEKNNCIKITTIFSTLCLILSIVSSIIFSFILRDKRILTYQWGSVDPKTIPDAFHPNIYFTYTFLITLLSINCCSVYFIYKERGSNFIRIIYRDLKWYFVLTQFFLGLLFLIGIIFEKGSISIISSFSLNLLCVILILFYYRAIKSKNNSEYSSYICCNLYISVIFSFLTFFLFYNFSELVMGCLYIVASTPIEEHNWALQIYVVVSFSVLCFIGIILLAYYKDIIYCFTTIYFGLGFLFDKEFNLHRTDTITVSILMAFSFIACVMTIIKYGKSTLGFDDDEIMNEVLIDSQNHKKSSWFYSGQN